MECLYHHLLVIHCGKTSPGGFKVLLTLYSGKLLSFSLPRISATATLLLKAQKFPS